MAWLIEGIDYYIFLPEMVKLLFDLQAGKGRRSRNFSGPIQKKYSVISEEKN
jgi:hypothetical protein